MRLINFRNEFVHSVLMSYTSIASDFMPVIQIITLPEQPDQAFIQFRKRKHQSSNYPGTKPCSLSAHVHTNLFPHSVCISHIWSVQQQQRDRRLANRSVAYYIAPYLWTKCSMFACTFISHTHTQPHTTHNNVHVAHIHVVHVSHVRASADADCGF